METTQRSLRYMIEKWLLMAPATSARVKRGSHASSDGRRCVCVEACRSTGPFSIYFFRQGDGDWDVLPHGSKRPAMGVV
ncbi:hypothetical protein BZM27_26065 [Paraburkholderia steynii]|uniref:Uncharacterized protein n=1 Tax=Paraburkholderia steynii TaxID=1245441 RepID=A0A4R0X8U3_9BURK|nr:hypothetical protein BZM27_26065 [Paraburkholderia steynii]